LAIIAFPIGLVWFAGIRGPGLLLGGSWTALPVILQGYLFVCGCAAAVLPFVAVARAMRPLPAAQLSNHSRALDVAHDLGYRPVGRGPHRLLTMLPGNELFRVEVSEKEYCLPRLPRALDGLSILHLSDLHFIGTVDRSYFARVAELAQELAADLAVFTGDLVDEPEFVEWLPDTLGRVSAPVGRYFVLGNHDHDTRDPERVRQAMVDLGWTNVAGRTITVDVKGRPLVIAGTELPWMGEHPDLSRVPADAFRLLLSHTPDHFAWARRHDVDLMLAGHNHGGQVRLPLYGPVYSPSRFGCRFAGGVYYEKPTLLYVSRGLSGRHPLRWRCPPEVTKLVLRAQ
jgi:predicted MPP superfamily phosphohydrolase